MDVIVHVRLCACLHIYTQKDESIQITQGWQKHQQQLASSPDTQMQNPESRESQESSFLTGPKQAAAAGLGTAL